MNTRLRSFGVLLACFCICVLPARPFSSDLVLKIMLSNDDGVDAPGIAALQTRLSREAIVTVVAPARNQSGVGHGYTFTTPIVVRQTEKSGSRWYSVEALPATCVKLGLETLLEDKQDMVISGINRGDNVGTMVFSSGTVACAREAAYKNLPAIAVSLESGPAMDYVLAADFVADLVRETQGRKLGPGVFLNVNIPALPRDKIKGVLVVGQESRPYPDYAYRKYSLEGGLYIWYDFLPLAPGGDSTDAGALRNGFIVITPFTINATDQASLESLSVWKLEGWKK
jgi:5'-nucleotidase